MLETRFLTVAVQFNVASGLVVHPYLNCFDFLGLISAMLMLGRRCKHLATPNDSTIVVSSNPCQRTCKNAQ